MTVSYWTDFVSSIWEYNYLAGQHKAKSTKLSLYGLNEQHSVTGYSECVIQNVTIEMIPSDVWMKHIFLFVWNTS